MVSYVAESRMTLRELVSILTRGAFVHAPRVSDVSTTPLVSKRYDGNVGWGSCCDSQSPGRTRLHSDIFEYRLGPGRDVLERTGEVVLEVVCSMSGDDP